MALGIGGGLGCLEAADEMLSLELSLIRPDHPRASRSNERQGVSASD